MQHSEKVFPDATVDVDSVFLKKTSDKQFIDITIGDIRTETSYRHRMLQKDLCQKEYINLYMTQTMCDLKKKIAEHSFFVKDFYDIKNGVKPYEKGKGKPKQTAETLKNKPFTALKQIDKKENFRRIIDLKNNSGWIHISQLKKNNSVIVIQNKVLFKKPSSFAKPIAQIEKGRLLIVDMCQEKWCKIKSGDFEGWIKTNDIWGLIN